MTDYSQKVKDLFDDQFTEWSLARDNYRLLGNVMVRRVIFDNYEIDIQFNPGRITSSAARVDAQSIEARPCFLCEKNRPPEQRGIPFGEDYQILVNPFPIFRRHLTIVSEKHTPQRIAGSFGTMLALAESLPEYVVFYNGPQCGASAPDHLHFQAGNRGFLPVESDAGNSLLCIQAETISGAELWLWRGYGRGMMTLKGDDSEALSAAFYKFIERFTLTQPERPEPMLNILAYHTNGIWTVHIIPRRVHRPACYFAEGDAKILLSPASVDIGGVFITPREEDFNRMNASDITAIFKEVCLSEEEMSTLTDRLL